ncbi:adenine deaminase C-terminal domain-containing protein [Dorea sp. D27]|uniref:adenine deaminase C-terminal domain-containing protein n=1 Tax=Dorea sp. D27 TaxID=658665 RepID=UPI0006730D31|nr:adenine deaminase C-terminal domain-containing protein [Dorea sp. D27]KMZ55131.1 adenine deaminase [Dorea sp. D27]
MEKVDWLIKNAEVYNSYLKLFEMADVYVLKDRIYYVCREAQKSEQHSLEAEHVLDGSGYRMLPGFVDIHMHIESSMMTPVSFGERAAECGVTTLVSEPHEIANIVGVSGIHEMINGAKDAPIDIYYGIPSSVPSTNSRLETTGGVIGFEEMKHLMDEDGVVCVGEVMNYRQIIRGDELEITKYLDYLREEDPYAVIEGHCPSLTGLDLAKFLYRGIDGDHTEHTLAELKDRFANGMFVEIQEKMLRQEVLDYIVENRLYEHCCFVTDDTMADELMEHGQLNHVVQTAAALGFPLEEAIYCASYTPARRMNLRDRGAIAPGRKADFQLLKTAECGSFQPEYVFKDGREIYRKGARRRQEGTYAFPATFYDSLHLPELTAQKLVPAEGIAGKEAEVRVIQVQDGCTQTKEVRVVMPVEGGRLRWEESGCMLAAVFERHGINGNIGYGFVTGDCISRGAAATTYYHDHHNLLVIGSNVDDMLAAARRIKELKGGICTAEDGTIAAELPLPVAGILSEEPADAIGRMLGRVRKSLISLGYRHYNPIMSLCTLGLPVSPALKLTDCGLVDVVKGETVPLIL